MPIGDRIRRRLHHDGPRHVTDGGEFTSDELDRGEVELELPDPSPDRPEDQQAEPWATDKFPDRERAYQEFLERWERDHPDGLRWTCLISSCLRPSTGAGLSPREPIEWPFRKCGCRLRTTVRPGGRTTRPCCTRRRALPPSRRWAAGSPTPARGCPRITVPTTRSAPSSALTYTKTTRRGHKALLTRTASASNCARQPGRRPGGRRATG